LLVCILGTFAPNALLSLVVKYQQPDGHDMMPYIYSWFSLPFSLIGGLLVLWYVAGIRKLAIQRTIIVGLVLLVGVLSVANDYVSGTAATILRQENQKWHAVDDLLASGDLDKIPANTVIYAPSLFVGLRARGGDLEGYWSHYFSRRMARNVRISAERPPADTVPDTAGQFFFSWSLSGDGRGYFWQFGPIAGENGDSRTIRIGEYSEWRQFRLLAHTPEEQSLAIQVNGDDPTIGRNARDGVLINKPTGKHYLGTVRAESRECPTFTIANASSH
jgi:hypothetical protein